MIKLVHKLRKKFLGSPSNPFLCRDLEERMVIQLNSLGGISYKLKKRQQKISFRIICSSNFFDRQPGIRASADEKSDMSGFGKLVALM